MPLYIRDNDVDALAIELKRATQVATKTEAVRAALTHELERVKAAMPVGSRIAKSMAMADAMGPGDDSFDMRAFTDEHWGDH